MSSDELALRDAERRQRDAKRQSKSLIRASSCEEQQAVVLVRHPDHTVGQARSTSVKPISDVVSCAKYSTFSWAVVRQRRMNYCWRIQKVGKDITKKAIFLFSVGNINHLWYLRKIERPFESRIRQQYPILLIPLDMEVLYAKTNKSP